MHILRHFFAREVRCALRYCIKYQAFRLRRLFSPASALRRAFSHSLASGHAEASRLISSRLRPTVTARWRADSQYCDEAVL